YICHFCLHLIFSLTHSHSRPHLFPYTTLFRSLRQQAEYLTLSELVAEVWEQSDYKQSLQEEGTLEATNRLENLDEFASVTKEFDQMDLEDIIETDPDFVDEADGATEEPLDTQSPRIRLTLFLTELSLVSDTTEEETVDQITLMTMHAAKGLEFPYVFIVGMEE